ncbi:Hypothetical predicted protein [Octopus vulgaris]|uniref:Uncharacterized protein n=1 Tax=Octopus vulgaris TaxID=6645 RepID=A0AA36AX10_OCTVU|nr:Hypothetical predicted protein [Octopus vulgaris]
MRSINKLKTGKIIVTVAFVVGDAVVVVVVLTVLFELNDILKLQRGQEKKKIDDVALQKNIFVSSKILIPLKAALTMVAAALQLIRHISAVMAKFS